mmetsp:Transcript_81230/g.175552  ORF Transcript_81230/g.175552 Transcript_81230/m.175552 type:complete len:309 (-) Transcript_81230:85-1011(-)
MLHLQTSIHLQEVEVLVVVAQHLDGTGGTVSDGLAQLDSLVLHLLAGLGVDQARRSFLHNLLVPSLHRAFSLGESRDIAIGVSNHLNLDVVGVLDESLNEHAVIPEGTHGLVLADLEGLVRLGLVVGHAHSLSSSTSTGLHHDWIANIIGKLYTCFGVWHFALVPGDDVALCITGDFLAVDLVTHQIHGLAAGANESNSIALNHICELGVFTEKTITRVDSLSSSFLGNIKNSFHLQITVSRSWSTNTVSLIGHSDVHTARVRFRINGNSLNSHFLGSSHNSAGDFSSVGNQNFVEETFPICTERSTT